MPSFIRSLSRSVRIALAVLCVASLAGCGPFGYLRKVSRDANRAVAEAEAAGAQEYAPYEYWGAVSYLEQAKILMAYSEYERSFDYGVRARQLAEEAKRKAERRESGKTVEALKSPATPLEEAQSDAAAAPTKQDEAQPATAPLEPAPQGGPQR